MRAWVYWAGLLAAFGLAFGAYSIVHEDRRMLASGVAVEGRMTGSYQQVDSTRNGRVTSTVYHPSFSYTTDDGRIMVWRVSDDVDLADIRRGRAMRLRYDPDDPSRIRLEAALQAGSGVGPWILGGAALLVGAGSLPGAFNRRFTRERSAPG
jgi:hypothetical protein